MVHQFMLRAAWPSFSNACLDFKVRIGEKHSGLPGRKAGCSRPTNPAVPFKVPAHQPKAVLAPATERFPGSPHPAVVVACALEYIYTSDYTPTARTLVSWLATPGQQHQQHPADISPQESGLAGAGCPSNAAAAGHDPPHSIDPNAPSAARTFYSRRHAIKDAALLSSGRASTVYGTQRVGPEVKGDEVLILHLAVWVYGMRYGLERMAELAMHKFVVAAVAEVASVGGMLGTGLGTGRHEGARKAEGHPSPGKSASGCDASVVHDQTSEAPRGEGATSNGESSVKKQGRVARKKSGFLRKARVETPDFQDDEDDDSEYVDEEGDKDKDHDNDNAGGKRDDGREGQEQEHVDKNNDKAEDPRSMLKRDIAHCITLAFTHLPAKHKVAEANGNSNNKNGKTQAAVNQANKTRKRKAGGSSSTKTPQAIRLCNPLPDAAPARAAVLAVLRVLFVPHMSGLAAQDRPSTLNSSNTTDYPQHHDGVAQNMPAWRNELSALVGHACADEVARHAAAAPPHEGCKWEDEIERLLLLRTIDPQTVAGGYDGAIAGHAHDGAGGVGGRMEAQGQDDDGVPAVQDAPDAHAIVPGQGGGGAGMDAERQEDDMQDDMQGILGVPAMGSLPAADVTVPAEGGGGEEWLGPVGRDDIMEDIIGLSGIGSLPAADATVPGEGAGGGEGWLGPVGQDDIMQDVLGLPAMASPPAADGCVPAEGAVGDTLYPDCHMGCELAADIAAMFDMME